MSLSSLSSPLLLSYLVASKKEKAKEKAKEKEKEKNFADAIDCCRINKGIRMELASKVQLPCFVTSLVIAGYATLSTSAC